MLTIKAFHIIAVVTWFAGLFYLPRLFVYHTGALQENDKVGSERFKRMERKLYFAITTPSAVVVVFLGFMLIGYNLDYYFSSLWMWIKFLLVTCLFIFHLQCGKYVRKFAADKKVPSERFFRWFNEFPAVVLIAVVLLVVIKPGF